MDNGKFPPPEIWQEAPNSPVATASQSAVRKATMSIAAFFHLHINTVNHPVCAVFFSIAVGSAVGAWFGGGDMFLTVPALFLALVAISIAWIYAPGLSIGAKAACMFVSAIALCAEGYGLHRHFSKASLTSSLPLPLAAPSRTIQPQRKFYSQKEKGEIIDTLNTFSKMLRQKTIYLEFVTNDIPKALYAIDNQINAMHPPQQFIRSGEDWEKENWEAVDKLAATFESSIDAYDRKITDIGRDLSAANETDVKFLFYFEKAKEVFNVYQFNETVEETHRALLRCKSDINAGRNLVKHREKEASLIFYSASCGHDIIANIESILAIISMSEKFIGAVQDGL